MEEWAIILLLDPYYICTVCTCYLFTTTVLLLSTRFLDSLVSFANIHCRNRTPIFSNMAINWPKGTLQMGHSLPAPRLPILTRQ
jgi:hypothetical protein